MSFITDRRVYFSETDGAGVVFFAQLFTFCHGAYEASLQQFGFDLQDFFRHSPYAYPIIHCQMDFLRPIFCGELLQIEMTGEQIAPSEFRTTYQIKAGTKLRARGTLVHCCIDRSSRRRLPLPPPMQAWLASLTVPDRVGIAPPAELPAPMDSGDGLTP